MSRYSSTEAPPVITIDDYDLDAVCQFAYIGFTITDNLSLDDDIDKRIGKAASTSVRLKGSNVEMEDSGIPEDILYGELALGRRTTGCPNLRRKGVCVRDMKAVDIDTMSWESFAADGTKFHQLQADSRPVDFVVWTLDRALAPLEII